MADEQDENDKTEDPTQKRLDDALKRGDVVKSQEVNTWFVIAGATLVLASFSGGAGHNVAVTLRGLIANSFALRVDGPALIALSEKIGLELLAALAVPFLLLLLAAIAGNVIQHRLVWSFEALTPKLSKISPAAGFKRLFSKQALANFAKGVVKLVLIGTVLTALMWPERGRLMALSRSDMTAVLPLTVKLALKLMGAVVAMLAVVAAADYLFQYRQWFEKQKMSLRELKEEFKQTEGDPADQGQDAAIAPVAHAQAHDGERAEGGGGDHQPDPLCGGAAIRARHGRARLRRQGPRRAGAQDQGNRGGAQYSGGGKPAARAHPARLGRNRSGRSARAL